jgi:hypothetical protein
VLSWADAELGEQVLAGGGGGGYLLEGAGEITKAQRDILAQLKIDPPPRIYQLTPAASP